MKKKTSFACEATPTTIGLIGKGFITCMVFSGGGGGGGEVSWISQNQSCIKHGLAFIGHLTVCHCSVLYQSLSTRSSLGYEVSF